MTEGGLAARLAAEKLAIIGGYHPEAEEVGLPQGTQTLLLIGPEEPGFWAHFTASAEWQDGAPDPMDRWSRRVLGRMACDLRAKALFPFGGPPYHPFYQWALKTGAIWDSPVRLLVHGSAGLWVSFRGALALRERVDLPQSVEKPCNSCARPCVTACPAGAIGEGRYDVAACHRFLDIPAGKDCLTKGCLVRRACPAAYSYARVEEHSAYHMGQFHK